MWDRFGSAMRMKMRADLSADGNIVDWRHELWSYPHARRPGGRDGVNLLAASVLGETLAADLSGRRPAAERRIGPKCRSHSMIFRIKKILKHYMPDAPLRTSSLRTLGAYASVFAIESLMDEAAAAAGTEPVNFEFATLCATERAPRGDRKRRPETAAGKRAPWATAAASPATRSGGAASAFAKYKEPRVLLRGGRRGRSRQAAAGSCVSHGPGRRWMRAWRSTRTAL